MYSNEAVRQNEEKKGLIILMAFTVLVGRLTADPQTRVTKQGETITLFTLAVNWSKENASFFDCIATGDAAEKALSYKQGEVMVATADAMQRIADFDAVQWKDPARAGETVRTSRVSFRIREIGPELNLQIFAGELETDPTLKEINSERVLVDNALVNGGVRKRFSVFGGQAQALAKHKKAGEAIVLVGKEKRETWEQNGQTRTSVKIAAQKVSWLPEEAWSRTETDGDTVGQDDAILAELQNILNHEDEDDGLPEDDELEKFLV